MLFYYLGWTQRVFGPDGPGGDLFLGGLIAAGVVILCLVEVNEIRKNLDRNDIPDFRAKEEIRSILTITGIGLLPILIATWPFLAAAVLAIAGYTFLYTLNAIRFCIKMLFGSKESSGSSSTSRSSLR